MKQVPTVFFSVVPNGHEAYRDSPIKGGPDKELNASRPNGGTGVKN